MKFKDKLQKQLVITMLNMMKLMSKNKKIKNKI